MDWREEMGRLVEEAFKAIPSFWEKLIFFKSLSFFAKS